MQDTPEPPGQALTADGPDRARMPRWARILLGVLIVQFVVLASVQAWQDSLTFDEPFYISGGYTGLVERDLRINFEHPPLPKLLAAIPAVAFETVNVPASSAWDAGDEWRFAQHFIEANSANLRRFVFLFRIVPILSGAAIGFALFAIGRLLFAWGSGLVSAALWLTWPVAVGFSHLNGLDVPGALVLLLVVLATLRYLDAPTWGRLGWIAAAAGAAMLTRSGIGMIAVVSATVIVIGYHVVHRQWLGAARALVVPLAGWSAVWLVYLVLDPATLGDPTPAMRDALEWDVESPWASLILAAPWPTGFEAGIQFLVGFHSQTSPFPGYLFGSVVWEVDPGFWAGSFFLKMTPVAGLAIILGLLGWIRLTKREVVRAVVVLGLPGVGWATMMSQATHPFGVRYLIPGAVLLFAAAGPLARWATNRATLAVFGAMTLLLVGFLWQSHPHSIAWTAPGFGPGWQVAADANVDWGQDFYRLQAWARDKDQPYVSYFGFGPSFELREIPNAVSAHPNSLFAGRKPVPKDTEWVVVSASNLNNPGVFGPRSVLRDHCPIDIIGATILVYRFAQDVAVISQFTGDPREPAKLCAEAEYSMRIER